MIYPDWLLTVGGGSGVAQLVDGYTIVIDDEQFTVDIDDSISITLIDEDVVLWLS